MEINKINTLNFNGLHITKNAHETIKNLFLDEIKDADKTYNGILSVKHTRKPNFKRYHDEKIFNKCFSDVWDKMDFYNDVIIDYAISDNKDLYIKQQGGKLVAEVFLNSDGNKTKINSTTFNNKYEFFGYFKNEFFRNSHKKYKY